MVVSMSSLKITLLGSIIAQGSRRCRLSQELMKAAAHKSRREAFGVINARLKPVIQTQSTTGIVSQVKRIWKHHFIAKQRYNYILVTPLSSSLNRIHQTAVKMALSGPV